MLLLLYPLLCPPIYEVEGLTFLPESSIFEASLFSEKRAEEFYFLPGVGGISSIII
jgi:hypothetical protein